jgi:hypothetical protein
MNALDHTKNLSAAARAAHQVAEDEVRRLTDADVPDGPVFDTANQAEEDGERTVAETRCPNNGEFFASAAHLLKTDTRAFWEPQHEDAFGSLAILVKRHLEQLAA